MTPTNDEELETLLKENESLLNDIRNKSTYQDENANHKIDEQITDNNELEDDFFSESELDFFGEDELELDILKNNEIIIEENTESEETKKEPETFYLNLFDFVESYLSKVYACNTQPSGKNIWLKDWWRYPAVVSRLNAIWISWEGALKQGGLDRWFLSSGDPMMRAIMDKEIGIMVHYKNDSNLALISPGKYLISDIPTYDYFSDIVSKVDSIGRKKQKEKQ